MQTGRILIPLAAAALSFLIATLPTLAESSVSSDALSNAHDATAAYTDPGAALASGYELLTDANDIACIDMPGQGGMGVHYVKGALVQSGTIDAARPQALVYEVGSNSRLRLVALEYVVLQATWEATHSGAPSLFGEKFVLTPAGNRFGLPAYYSLHAWIWKHNPSGMFNMWNPQVTCGNSMTVGDDEAMDSMATPLSMADQQTTDTFEGSH